MSDSRTDLREDVQELAALAASGIERLSAYRGSVEASADRYRAETRLLLLRQADELMRSYEAVRFALGAELDRAEPWSPHDCGRIALVKKTQGDALRILQGSLGANLAAGDWQSPTFLHSEQSRAGKQTGQIVGTMNDYKRDGHLDALAFEHAFRDIYIDAPMRMKPNVYTTSSGMSAFTTLLNHLRFDMKLRGPIVVGASSYFENRIVLEKAFSGLVHVVDEMDVERVIETVKRVKPHAVFLDSLCNTETIAVPNLRVLLPKLMRLLPKHSALVLDNTGMGVMYQPLRDLPRIPTHARLFVIESLNKYYQFGFDRVTGGVVWTSGGEPSGLMRTRTHLGTTLPDASVLAIPAPNRALLEKRLLRLGRNAHLLASALDVFVRAHPESHVSHVVYPGLASYPGFAWTESARFNGSFFVLAFKPKYQRVADYQAFVSRVMDEAKIRSADIVSGTSFGFSTTRIYLTAVHATGVTKPFIRVSVGTETVHEIERLYSVFESALL